ncbi:MAG: hypothetical protein KC777_04455 [Cyanobacteria bacterium HKST-UBA02]|nr:hypothetical protein [Cyanobacteria bacterium HKST-UBA02]
MILDTPGNGATAREVGHSSINLASLVERPQSGSDNAHQKPPEPKAPEQNQKQNQDQSQRQTQDQSQSQKQNQNTEVNVGVDNRNNNNNNNKNENTNYNNTESNSSSSSSSSSDSHSNSSSDSRSSASTGPIDNKSGATGGSVQISETNSSSFKYYNPSSVILAPLPPGGGCTEGGSWGVGSIFGGLSKGKSKINEKCQAIENEKFQQNLDLQNRSLDLNIELQKEAMKANLEQQAQQAEGKLQAQSDQLHLDRVKTACDASVDQAEQARATFTTMDGMKTGGAKNTVGSLAHQEALNSLKLGNICATALGQELGVEDSAPSLPPIDGKEK